MFRGSPWNCLILRQLLGMLVCARTALTLPPPVVDVSDQQLSRLGRQVLTGSPATPRGGSDTPLPLHKPWCQPSETAPRQVSATSTNLNMSPPRARAVPYRRASLIVSINVTATRAGSPAFGNSLLLLTKSRCCAGQHCSLGPRKTHAFDAETLLAGITFGLWFLEVVAPALARAYFSANRNPFTRTGSAC